MMNIHHIGIACADIDTAVDDYSKIFPVLKSSGKFYDAHQDAMVELVETGTGLNVEFIEGHKVAELIKKGLTYYHLCFEVEHLDTEIDAMVKNGALVVSAPQKAILFDNRRVAFLFTPGGLVELLEK